ncbi:Polyketide synthase enoylreductase [Penicillium atrosanguineum]|nr:Polyketide synthase enoylreductase [Penicillium atrosanguineum]
MPEPTPRNSEVLVRVHAAGVTGDEILWPEPYAAPSRIPGHDISGVISAFGPDYSGPLKHGQEVYAMIAADRGEGQADYVICLADEVTPKPTSISHEEAAALPIPILTAWEGLIDHGALKAGMRVLVTGASGAVGTFAVQFATQLAGAHVIALASSKNHELLRQLGAHEVLDYNASSWKSQVTDVDLVFDTVGGDVLIKSWETVKDDGAIVTVGDPAPSWAFGRGRAVESIDHPKVRHMHFILTPNAERMQQASDMIDAGTVKVLAVETFPFHKAEEAWAFARQRSRNGKVVIKFAEAENSQSSHK